MATRQNTDYGYDIQKVYLEMMMTDAETFVRCQAVFDPKTFDRRLQPVAKFLNDYVEHKIFEKDPFVSIDEDGVGELVEIASSRGRKTNKNIKLGICGEHGGDPKSIEFCSRTGLNYVSCSPFRVPVARLAAAQAELSK